ncbi:MAG TPA: DUF4337 domain-containing protein [Candidatus Binatia bacterium]|nr:DUF4337 domain-containing protein [Candidatus Binatia bacterium]
MEEQEVSTEHLHDIIREHGHRAAWAEKVALTTALLAMMAAVSNLMSTHESDRAIQLKVEASDRWSYYQAKSIKGMITPEAAEKARYREEQEQIRKEAEAFSSESKHATHIHEFFAYAVTIFQVATAIGAIAVLIMKRSFWYASIALGAIGLGLALRAILLL